MNNKLVHKEFEANICPECGLDKNRLKNWAKLWGNISQLDTLREKAEAYDLGMKVQTALVITLVLSILAMKLFW